MRILNLALLATAALAGGCVPADFLQPDAPASGAAMVSNSPFSTPPPTIMRTTAGVKQPQGSPEVAIAVDRIGQELLAANKSIGLKPLFLTIGAPQPEVFHQESSVVFITESLVRQCATEGQLAALLSVELAKMVSEREALASPQTRTPDRKPPLNVAMGNAGQFTGLDQLQQEEMAKLDSDRRQSLKKVVPLDPMALARNYLDAAGFARSDLDAVAPLLAQAERNYLLEKQFNGASEIPMGTPR